LRKLRQSQNDERSDDRFRIERGWTINTPRETDQRGGSVMIGVDDAKLMVERLSNKSLRRLASGAGLRISPHFFNTDDEVEEALTFCRTDGVMSNNSISTNRAGFHVERRKR
jgi:selenocysteine lyase/cysteine desulfurase